MAKLIEYGETAKVRSIDALNRIANIVGSTLGPAGSPVLLTRERSAQFSTVFHTKDGITVLNELQFADPVEDAIHKLACQASTDTVISSGDGPQPLWAKILTPTGFIKMEDVRVGMDICGTNGSIQKVIGVFPKGEKEIYEVEFSNKRVVECCEDHLWTVTNTAKQCKVENKTTKELQADYLSYKKCGHKVHRYYTPRTEVEFSNKENMPLDPYLVGILLGDGSLSGTGSIEMSLGKKKEHIIEKIKLPEGFSLTTTYVNSKNAYRVKIKGKNAKDQTIHDVIETVGLLGTNSHTKFIPPSYLYSSIETRTQLLQGLVDTDGHINKRGCLEFSSVSKTMADDFVTLCRSLGKTVNVIKHNRGDNSGSYSMTPIYRIYVSNGPKHGNQINRITATGKKTVVQCIKVSNTDSLYITDGFIATHNTTSTLLLASAFANELRNQGGNNPQSAIRKFKTEIFKAIDAIKEETVSSDEANYRVALTSTNSDEELTKTVMEALAGTSAYGTVVVEKSPITKQRFTVDKEYGYQAGIGYHQHNDLAISISDNAVSNADFYMDDVFVIPYNGNLMQLSQIANIVNTLPRHVGTTFKLIFVCYDFSDEIVFELIKINKTSQAKIFVTKTTATAEINGPWQQLNDIAAFSGATVLDAGTATAFSIEHAGRVKRVRITPYKTFISGMSTKNWVAKRAEQNQKSLELAAAQIDKDIISSRNSSLTGGLVKIIVGGGIPSELQELADRADDAIRAVQACKRSGALPGAGCSYIRAGQLANVSDPVRKALAVVHETIMANYGETPRQNINKGEVVKISDNSVDHGDFLELGIADSFETIKSVLLNGFALGSLVANLGGYSVRQNIEELRQHMMLKQILES